MGTGAAADGGAASHRTLLAISPSYELFHALRLLQDHRDVDLVALSDSSGLFGAHALHRPDLVVAEIEAGAQVMPSLRLLHDTTGCPIIAISSDPSSVSAAPAATTRLVTPPVEVAQLIAAFDEVLAVQEDRDTDRTAPHSRPPPPPKRRAPRANSPAIATSEPIRWGPFSVDPTTRIATCDGQDLPLTRTEFDLLMLFVLHPHQVLTRQQIVDNVWGSWSGDHHHVDVHLSRLRRKIARASGLATLPAVRGVGFRLLAPTSEISD